MILHGLLFTVDEVTQIQSKEPVSEPKDSARSRVSYRCWEGTKKRMQRSAPLLLDIMNLPSVALLVVLFCRPPICFFTSPSQHTTTTILLLLLSLWIRYVTLLDCLERYFQVSSGVRSFSLVTSATVFFFSCSGAVTYVSGWIVYM